MNGAIIEWLSSIIKPVSRIARARVSPLCATFHVKGKSFSFFAKDIWFFVKNEKKYPKGGQNLSLAHAFVVNVQVIVMYSPQSMCHFSVSYGSAYVAMCCS